MVIIKTDRPALDAIANNRNDLLAKLKISNMRKVPHTMALYGALNIVFIVLNSDCSTAQNNMQKITNINHTRSIEHCTCTK